MDAKADAALLLRAVVELSTEDRDLLILSGWEHLNSTEIGQALSMTPSTVRSRLRRLRAELQDALDSIDISSDSHTGATR